MNFLDHINLGRIWCTTYWAERKRWQPRSLDGPQQPRIYFGHESIPSPDAHAFGGMVKLQDLQEAFPNRKEQPNILYLVSSALPYFPERMALFAKEAGAKLIVNQNGVAYPGWYGKGWEKANASMKQLLHTADHVFYQSGFCRESADKFLGRPRSGQHEILHNPVDTSFFKPSGAHRSVDAPVVILLAGSHWSPYRVRVALETLEKARRKNDRICLQIAGRFCWLSNEQDARDEIIEYARELGVSDHVNISGPYTQKQAPELLNRCSILLHTKYNDPCPRLVVEAMACGLPVVFSATGGVPELVGEEAGVGVPGPLDWEKDHPPDSAELAAAVDQVVADWSSYSEAARSRAVQNFDVASWLNRHRQVFQQVLGQAQMIL